MKPRGFILMSPERRREVAAMGGRAVQASGKAFRFKEDAHAKAAGRKGGLATWSRWKISRKGKEPKHAPGTL
jgi:general stress protein YciG